MKAKAPDETKAPARFVVSDLIDAVIKLTPGGLVRGLAPATVERDKFEYEWEQKLRASFAAEAQ